MYMVKLITADLRRIKSPFLSLSHRHTIISQHYNTIQQTTPAKLNNQIPNDYYLILRTNYCVPTP